MSNTLTTAWVKNVYSLRMNTRTTSWKNQVSYTPPTLSTVTTWVQLPTFTQLTTMLWSVLSTLKNSYLPLVITELYPVSTAPIIKKKKENKERNS